MTGKRFILYDGLDIKDNVTGEIIPPCLDKGLKRLIDLLNALNDENEQLKSLCIILIKNIEKKSIAFVIDEEIRKLLE